MCARELRVRLSDGRLSPAAIFLILDAFEHAERRLLRFIGWIVGFFRRLERWRVLRRFIEQHAQWRFERRLAELGRRFERRRWLLGRRVFVLSGRWQPRRRFFRRPEWRRLVWWQLGRIAGRR